MVGTNFSQRRDFTRYHPTPTSKPFDTIEVEHAAPDGIVQGGSGMLQDQLECPFRAFARHRLGVRQEREPSEFPDALERGIVLHSVMQRLGNTYATRKQLLALTTEEIYAACEHVLMQQRPLPDLFVANECARLAH